VRDAGWADAFATWLPRGQMTPRPPAMRLRALKAPRKRPAPNWAWPAPRPGPPRNCWPGARGKKP
jgi:hypothetical protein